MSRESLTKVFAGLDWAVHTHAVCVIDTVGGVLERFEVAHDRDGLTELMRRLAGFGVQVRIAIERPSGLIVDALVEAGHHVFRSGARDLPVGQDTQRGLPMGLQPPTAPCRHLHGRQLAPCQ